MGNTVSRIKQYIDYKGVSVRRFEESVGFSNGSFASQFKNNKTIGVDKVENILRVYSDINPDWLLTGKGEMLRNENPEQAQETNTYSRDPRDIAMIELQNKQIALLEDKVRLLEHNANPFDTSNFTRVPSVPHNQDAAYADRDKSPKRAPKEPQK